MTAHHSAGRFRGLIVVLGAAIVALFGLQIAGKLGEGTSLPVLGAVPAFSLTDQQGQPFSSKDLADRVWIATFIYTTCPGPCPRVVERIRAVDSELAHDARVRLVSFSVDPTTDTPETLAAYGRARGIDPARWVLLTGAPDEIYTLARLGFKLGVDAGGANATPESGPVVHSVYAALVDSSGRVRGYYDTGVAEAMPRLVEDTRRLLGEPPA